MLSNLPPARLFGQFTENLYHSNRQYTTRFVMWQHSTTPPEQGWYWGNRVWTSVFYNRVLETNQKCSGGKLILGSTVKKMKKKKLILTDGQTDSASGYLSLLLSKTPLLLCMKLFLDLTWETGTFQSHDFSTQPTRRVGWCVLSYDISLQWNV